MRRSLVAFVVLCLAMYPLVAERHPKAADIQKYVDKNPIEPRTPELMIYVSQKSEELNAKGYEEYARKRYREAISYFEEAVRQDEDNSFAWYNLACSYSLDGNCSEAARCLKQATERDWFWGAKVMVDPSLDQCRHIGISYSYDENDPTVSFTHDLGDDGTVRLVDRQRQPPRRIGVGYFCIVVSTVFEFFPELDSYNIESPHGWTPVPRSANRVRVPRIRLK